MSRFEANLLEMVRTDARIRRWLPIFPPGGVDPFLAQLGVFGKAEKVGPHSVLVRIRTAHHTALGHPCCGRATAEVLALQCDSVQALTQPASKWNRFGRPSDVTACRKSYFQRLYGFTATNEKPTMTFDARKPVLSFFAEVVWGVFFP